MKKAGFLEPSVSFVKRALLAMEKSANTTFILLIASQDPNWCDRNLNNISDHVHIMHQKRFVEFAVLTRVDYLILAAGSSTFGWWAAYLNERKKQTIMNKQFARNGSSLLTELNPPDYYYKGMTLL